MMNIIGRKGVTSAFRSNALQSSQAVRAVSSVFRGKSHDKDKEWREEVNAARIPYKREVGSVPNPPPGGLATPPLNTQQNVRNLKVPSTLTPPLDGVANILTPHNLRFPIPGGRKNWFDPKFEDDTIVHYSELTPFHYMDPAFYKEEQGAIFSKNWLPVCFTSDLEENRVLCRSMYGREFLVVKNKSGEINAFVNACRHRGARVAKRDSNQKVLVCPYHAWKYDLSGNLKKVPRYENEAFDKAKFGLQPIRCEVFRNMVLMNFTPLDSEGMIEDDGIPYLQHSIPDIFGGLTDDLSHYPLEQMQVVNRKKYHVKSNWKSLIDNFQEYYHLPSVHPGLVQVSTMEGHVCTQKEEGKYIGFETNPLTCAGQPIDPDEKILPFLPGIKGTRWENAAVFHVLYPNMFYFLMPNHWFTVIVEPISATESIEHAALLVHKDVAKDESKKKEIQAIWDFYDTVNYEDLSACEEVQLGIADENVSQERIFVKPYEKTIQRFHEYMKDDIQKHREQQK